MANWQDKFSIVPKNYAYTRGQGRKVGAIAVLIFILAILLSDEFRYNLYTFFDYPLHYKEYKEFGIRIPGQYEVHGIDVSRWQSKVDWERVKKMKVGDKRIQFVFIKATEGTWLTDPQFSRNFKNARKAGLIVGAYHYFLPDINAKDQATKFVTTARLGKGDLPPVIDVEETRGMNKTQVRRYTKEFLNIMEKHYKARPILYTNLDFYKRYFAGEPDFEPYRLWIAHYHVSSLNMPEDQQWHFWQHSDRGNVNGINERVDFNVFNGDSIALRKICM
jgi:lysozyme